MQTIIAAGANIMGGCCGTTPDHIGALASKSKGKENRSFIPEKE
jgi:methionine synthase I (cobalamin-dependent)